jgi:hypothetical protein
MLPTLKHAWEVWKEFTKTLGRGQAAVLLWIAYITVVALTALVIKVLLPKSTPGWTIIKSDQHNWHEQY